MFGKNGTIRAIMKRHYGLPQAMRNLAFYACKRSNAETSITGIGSILRVMDPLRKAKDRSNFDQFMDK